MTARNQQVQSESSDEILRGFGQATPWRDRRRASALQRYRQTQAEISRSADVVRLVQLAKGDTALDVGARDGHFSRILAEHFEAVTALDLEWPPIEHPRITCTKGDVTAMTLGDASFDLVVCTEVLEHITPARLAAACSELTRVSRDHVLLGVPCQQDTRVGRTTCAACGLHNPPWGHVNEFDEARLRSLFPALSLVEVSYVGVNTESTNALSTRLMDLAGNPFGTYDQDEPCIGCGAQLGARPQRNVAQKVLTKAAFWARAATERWRPARAKWIHCLMRKN